MEYNDELLNPDIYDKMAKEYTKHFKDMLKEKQNNFYLNTFKYVNNLNNYFVCLNNNKNISKINLKHLTIINNNFNLIKNIYLKTNNIKFDNNKLNNNYCNILTNIILDISNIIKFIYNNNYFNFDNNLINSFLTILNETTLMFGVCKYRK